MAKSVIKAANIIISSIMTKAVTIEGNSVLAITGDDLNYSIPSGYGPIGYNILNLDTSAFTLISVNLGATTSSTVLRIVNRTSSQASGTISLRVCFAKR